MRCCEQKLPRSKGGGVLIAAFFGDASGAVAVKIIRDDHDGRVGSREKLPAEAQIFHGAR